MTKQEAIREACSIVSLAYRSMGDYSTASDGFCEECEANQSPLSNYSNQGFALQYVREAVLLKLELDGYSVDNRFDPNTGQEL